MEVNRETERNRKQKQKKRSKSSHFLFFPICSHHFFFFLAVLLKPVFAQTAVDWLTCQCVSSCAVSQQHHHQHTDPSVTPRGVNSRKVPSLAVSSSEWWESVPFSPTSAGGPQWLLTLTAVSAVRLHIHYEASWCLLPHCWPRVLFAEPRFWRLTWQKVQGGVRSSENGLGHPSILCTQNKTDADIFTCTKSVILCRPSYATSVQNCVS